MNRHLIRASRLALVAPVITIATLPFAGCESEPVSNAPSTQPNVATDVDPARATNEYWLAQTPSVSAIAHNFDKLWAAAEDVSRDYLFKLDRRDKRSGLLTTQPNISAQWFEFWRPELQSAEDKLISSTSSHRRTIYWQFAQSDGGYSVTPRVIVERQVLAERRVSGLLSKAYFRRLPNDNTYGTRETDVGVNLPQSYWYPVGRDSALEQKLVEKVDAQLQ